VALWQELLRAPAGVDCIAAGRPRSWVRRGCHKSTGQPQTSGDATKTIRGWNRCDSQRAAGLQPHAKETKSCGDWHSLILRLRSLANFSGKRPPLSPKLLNAPPRKQRFAFLRELCYTEYSRISRNIRVEYSLAVANRSAITATENLVRANLLTCAGRFDTSVSVRGAFFFGWYFACVPGWLTRARKETPC